MTAIAQQERLSAQEYFARYPETMQRMELIEGEVITLPSPTDEHQLILVQLTTFLNLFVSQNKLGSLRAAPLDVTLDDHIVVQPDLFFVRKGSTTCTIDEHGKWQGSPDLCIEILSTNVRHDRVKKLQLYEQFGVQEYWMVDPQARYVEIHTLQEGKLRLTADFAAEDTLTSPLLVGLGLNLKEVFPVLAD